ncbi:unnamed protein product [Medioppia subpectinata]|uniref:G-protein coupled receptors family 1 profile domain-containing protein n=1 Tax=Medioppia subpectinata TaxID=1979941 RepID=A0A7R9KKK1_9ACAR|nr:unnamed protein product [Medioppia subpectinata]CAG2103960.1 unnamed protein product [Medioppia subpectinata]
MDTFSNHYLNFTTISSALNDNTMELNITEYPSQQISPNLSCDPEYIEFRNNSRFWVQRVLVPIIMIIGVIGNSITIVIMTRRKMRSSTNSYLAALATFDMLYLIFIFYLSLSAYPNIKDVQYYYYWYFWPFAIMIADASSNTSIWLTVTFTIERYIAVCHPIRGKVLCTESRAKRVILCVFLICFTFTLPTPFEWVVVEKNSTETGRVYLQAIFSELGQNDLYRTVYYYLNVLLFALIPFLSLAIFNAFLIRSVHVSRKQRNTMIQGEASAKMDPTTKQESRITIMLIAVVILFLMCQLPTASVLIYSVFYNVEAEETNTGCLMRGLGNIFNFLLAINATGNFVLYCLLSQKYRRTFLAIFCPCLKSKFLTHQSGGYQRTFYTQVANHNHNGHKFSDNELNIRFHFNDSSRRMSSPRQKIYHSNQFINAGRLSTGSLTPYLADNRRSMKCSLSANYLQVPTNGSTSRLMIDNSVTSSGDDVSTDIDDKPSASHNDANNTADDGEDQPLKQPLTDSPHTGDTSAVISSAGGCDNDNNNSNTDTNCEIIANNDCILSDETLLSDDSMHTIDNNLNNNNNSDLNDMNSVGMDGVVGMDRDGSDATGVVVVVGVNHHTPNCKPCNKVSDSCEQFDNGNANRGQNCVTECSAGAVKLNTTHNNSGKNKLALDLDA